MVLSHRNYFYLPKQLQPVSCKEEAYRWDPIKISGSTVSAFESPDGVGVALFCLSKNVMWIRLFLQLLEISKRKCFQGDFYYSIQPEAQRHHCVFKNKAGNGMGQKRWRCHWGCPHSMLELLGPESWLCLWSGFLLIGTLEDSRCWLMHLGHTFPCGRPDWIEFRALSFGLAWSHLMQAFVYWTRG